VIHVVDLLHHEGKVFQGILYLILILPVKIMVLDVQNVQKNLEKYHQVKDVFKSIVHGQINNAMENYYKRIEIKGEGDLPKKKGTYMICNRQSFYMQTRFNPKLHESKNVWLKEVIWYEVPCNEKIEALEELCDVQRGLINELDSLFTDKEECANLYKKISELESKLKEV
jgi:hypothetical protein